ncbi:hypothetical protein GCM10007989_24610 [Devosia pacifica]|uniref:HTH cro/C1-type domain-containing protein n=1 Tax=Devosia pacifica TaxID=1335967 RepID=A0A918VUU2_9HYPH|nr:helix-turn-helix transcriptional regulator [Devosia pacifica]GHA27793.1 hypothetical protein GCM10007989_24610 [Devosia pacifica]
MYSHPQHSADQEQVAFLRREAGKWLRGLREAANLSQRDLASRVGFERYAFVSGATSWTR